ncbi:11987_t:CDS:2 [Ambispora leptoticha]|uniref:11987_t:CDS:1 n=1 Tax=Ambispora leptoticha TaxID=144679 RepID=A0A9N9BNA7_9GLOM|nr:11987_t:CDS:2 [Ambispora leptoticha]
MLPTKIELRQSKNITIQKVSQIDHMKMLFQGIEIEKSSYEDSKNFFDSCGISNKTKTHVMFCEIIKEKASIEYDITKLKPTAELHLAIEEALASNEPIENLNFVFQKFGYFFTTKVIIGDKLTRSVRFTGKKYSDCSGLKDKNLFGTHIFDKFSEKEKLLEQWKEQIKPINSSFMLTINGDIVERSDIPKWLESKESDWNIVKRVVIPLYKILDIKQQFKIKNLLTKENRVLMKKETLLIDASKSYHRCIFNEPLKSYNYQVFGKIVSLAEADIDVQFSCKSKSGFSVNWNKKIEEEGPITFQWMLIGCPSEIGYYDSKTRNVSVKMGFTKLKLEPKNEIEAKNELKSWYKQIDVGITLQQQHAISIDVECASTVNRLIFFQSAYSIISASVIEIRVGTNEAEILKLLKKDTEFLVNIRWCVTFEELVPQ